MSCSTSLFLEKNYLGRKEGNDYRKEKNKIERKRGRNAFIGCQCSTRWTAGPTVSQNSNGNMTCWAPP